MNEMVKHLIKNLGASRRRPFAVTKRELAMVAGGVLVGVAVGAVSTVIAASRSWRAARDTPA